MLRSLVGSEMCIRDSHSRVGQCQRHALSFTKESGAHRVGLVVKRRDLHEVEWQIALPPAISPILNHCREQGLVLLRCFDVRLALIPNHTTARKRQQRFNHTVVASRRAALIQPPWLIFTSIGSAAFLQLRRVLGKGLFELRELLAKHFLARPCLRRRTTPIGRYQSDRYVYCLLYTSPSPRDS